MPTLNEARKSLKWNEKIIRDRNRGYEKEDDEDGDKYIHNPEGTNTGMRVFYLKDPSVGDTSDMDAEEIEKYRQRRKKHGIRL
jgi:hypothetical protein